MALGGFDPSVLIEGLNEGKLPFTVVHQNDGVAGTDPGPLFFSTGDEDGLGSIMDVVCLDATSGGAAAGSPSLDDDLDADLLLDDADLLDDDDEEEEDALTVQLSDDDEFDDHRHDHKQNKPDKVAPKFQMRIQPANKIGKRRRGRPTKEEVAARILANGGVPPPPSAAGGKGSSGRRRTITKRQQLLSAKTKSLRRKISSSAWGKVHRERRNGSVDVMKKVIPGVGSKLDTAGVLELAINYILFLKKKMAGTPVDAEFLCRKESLAAGASGTK